MEIILISSQIDTSDNVLKTTVGTPIAIITASLIQRDDNNIRHIVTSYNKHIKLKLIDENGNEKSYLKGEKIAQAFNGVAYFLTCSIIKPGSYILTAETLEKETPTIKDGMLLTTISYNFLSMKIKYITESVNLLPNIPYVFEMIIVDAYDNKIDFSTRPSSPTLKMAINQMPDIAVLATGEKVPSFNLEPDDNNVYQFIFTAKQAGSYYIYLVAYDPLTDLRQNSITSNFRTLDVIYNNNGVGAVVPHLNVKSSYGLSSSVHLEKKIDIVKKTAENRKISRTTPFETGLSSSQQLSYKIKKPQEHNSIPISVDNSYNNEFSTFIPRIRAPFSKSTIKTALYDVASRGMTSGTMTNMQKTHVEQTSANTFVLPNTLRSSDLLTRNKVKTTQETKFTAKLDTFNLT